MLGWLEWDWYIIGGSGDIGVVMVNYAGYFGVVVVVVTFFVRPAFVIVVGVL